MHGNAHGGDSCPAVRTLLRPTRAHAAHTHAHGCLRTNFDLFVNHRFNPIVATTHAQAQGCPYDWYFCRGYFLQATNSFQYYTEAELGKHTCA